MLRCDCQVTWLQQHCKREGKTTGSKVFQSVSRFLSEIVDPPSLQEIVYSNRESVKPPTYNQVEVLFLLSLLTLSLTIDKYCLLSSLGIDNLQSKLSQW